MSYPKGAVRLKKNPAIRDRADRAGGAAVAGPLPGVWHADRVDGTEIDLNGLLVERNLSGRHITPTVLAPPVSRGEDNRFLAGRCLIRTYPLFSAVVLRRLSSS